MADKESSSIDAIISGVAGNTRADFSKLGDIPDAYRKAQDFAYQEKMRNLFSDENGGLPRDDKGNVDTGQMYERLMQAGGAGAVDSADKVVNSGLTQARVRFAPTAAAALRGDDNQSPATDAPVFPPSANRNAPVKVAPALARGGLPQEGQQPPAAGAAGGGDKPGSLMGFLSNWGVPDELAGSEMNILGGKLSAALGRRVDPNQPLDMNDPRTRTILGDWVRSRGGRGDGGSSLPQSAAQTAPAQPQAAQPQVAQAQPPAQGVPPQQPQGPPQPQPAPVAAADGQPARPPYKPPAAVPGDDPQIAQLRKDASRLEYVRAFGLLTPEADKAYEAKLGSIYKQLEARSAPTPEMKNYQQSRADPAFDQRTQDNASAEAWAKGDAETRVKQYQSLVTAGVKGLQEIPQLRMLQNEMEKPNFYSGAGERYNYLYKQLKSAVGIDPNASVPQDLLRKVAANNIISNLTAFNGMGQIRVAEIKLTQTAANSPETSVPANKFLAETAIRVHQRNAQIADMAQSYNEGHLDAGFDRKVLDYEKSHPLYSRAEIADWSKVIGEDAARSQPAARAAATTPQQFSSQTDPRRAGAKSGDIIADENGKKFRVR
jgi:hypothetical protein